MTWGYQDEQLVVAVQGFLRRFDEVGRALSRAQTPVDERLAHHERAFARWYRGRGSIKYRQFAEYQDMGAVHARSHALVRELLALALDGQLGQARTRLPELEALRAQLLSAMGGLEHRLRGDSGADDQ